MRGTTHTPAVVLGLGVAALTAAGLPWAGPATAQARVSAAAHVERGRDSDTIVFTGGDAVNQVRVTATVVTPPPWETHEFLVDDVVPVAAGDGCVHPDESDPTRVLCVSQVRPGQLGPPSLHVDLDEGDDALLEPTGVTETAIFRGGPGDDRIAMGYASGFSDGGAGNDRLTGGVQLRGGSGDDVLVVSGLGSEGHGDDGNDHLMAAEGEESWLEMSFTGGRGDDLIEGSPTSDWVYGNSGDDEIRGGRGDDDLFGGPDRDVVYGNSGDDRVHGGPGTDRLSGGPGTDEVDQD
jgi:Ca2+-binding RTX toxin-like protein